MLRICFSVSDKFDLWWVWCLVCMVWM